MNQLTDQQLLWQARTGDAHAFDLLVDRHGTSLLRLATSLVGNPADAQDVLQETLLGAYQSMHRFEQRASVRTWLTRILVRQVARHRRWQRIRKMLPLPDFHSQQDHPSRQPALESASNIAAADARMDLAELMAQLTPEHRDVLALRELQGLGYEEIAQVLGLPRGTVESRLFRARQALRNLLVGGSPTEAGARNEPRAAAAGQAPPGSISPLPLAASNGPQRSST